MRGWAAYYRTVVSSEAFSALDDYMWRLTYKWATAQPPEQAEALGRRPVLRPVQPVQARPVGVRRPRQRRLPHQVRLDEDRPAPDGRRHVVTRRPGPGRLLGRAARRSEPCRSAPTEPAPARSAARPLPALRGPAAARRPRAAKPTRVGTVVASHPQGDRQTRDRHRCGRPARRTVTRLIHAHCHRRLARR